MSCPAYPVIFWRQAVSRAAVEVLGLCCWLDRPSPSPRRAWCCRSSWRSRPPTRCANCSPKRPPPTPPAATPAPCATGPASTRRATASSWRCRCRKPPCCSSWSTTWCGARPRANSPGNCRRRSIRPWSPPASRPRSARGRWRRSAIGLPYCPRRIGSNAFPIRASNRRSARC